jgi:hypothetical protein
MRPILIGFGAGIVSALLLLVGAIFGNLGAVLLIYLAPLPLALAGLTLGLPAVLAGLAGGVIAGLSLSGPVALAHLLTVGLPVAVLVRQALLARSAAEAGDDGADVVGEVQWYPLGRLVVWLGGFAVALFAVVMVVLAGEPGGVVGWLDERLLLMLETYGANFGTLVTERTAAEVAAQTARLMPAIMAVVWMGVMVLNFALAQGLAKRFGRNLRPSPRFEDLVLPRWLGAVLGAALLLAFASGDAGLFGGVVLGVVFAAYLVQGLSVLHKAAQMTPVPGLVMAGVVVSIGVFGVPAVLVAALGLVEDWFRLRRRIGGGRPGKEV